MVSSRAREGLAGVGKGFFFDAAAIMGGIFRSPLSYCSAQHRLHPRTHLSRVGSWRSTSGTQLLATVGHLRRWRPGHDFCLPSA